MKLYVKPGREYRLEGKNYSGGQEVDVPEKFVRLLTHAKGPLEKSKAENPTDLPTTPEGIAKLRREYEEVSGKRPFHGWGETALREKIGSYRTTHMTAQK